MSSKAKGLTRHEKKGKWQLYLSHQARRWAKSSPNTLGKKAVGRPKGYEAKILERKRYEAELADAEILIAKLRKMMKASGVFFVEPTR